MGRPIDHRVDLYGAGVVLYQMVAGRTPFVGPPESLMYKVVNEIPLPPSAAEGARNGALFDAVLARALAKDPVERWPHAAAFRDAVVQALGAPAPAAVSPEAVGALPQANEYAPTERIPTMHRAASATSAPPTDGFTGTGSAPTHWDPGVLAKVEAALARHVGPLASVMVRRAARECHDMPALYARLGEQITQSSAREAFLHGAPGGYATGGTQGTHGTHGTHGSHGIHRRATGTGTFGGEGEFFKAWGATDVAQARRLVDICLDAGAAMFDSADIYSKGAAESILGEAIKNRARDELIISTKAGYRMWPGPYGELGSRKYLLSSLDQSLKRMQLDYVDVVFCHRPDYETPMEETCRAFDWLIRKGYAYYWGTSEWNAEDIAEAHFICEKYGLNKPVVEQPQYNLYAREKL